MSRGTEEELALLRRYVDELEARHGLRSETAAGVRWDIDLALEGDVLALAKCLGQLRTARRHKQGSAILASLETEGGGHGGGDGIPGGGPGAGRRDAVDVPSVGGDAMSNVDHKSEDV